MQCTALHCNQKQNRLDQTHLLRSHRRLVEVRRQYIPRHALQPFHRSFAHEGHRRQPLGRPRALAHGLRHRVLADLVDEADRLDWGDCFEEDHCAGENVSRGSRV
jgi:hypothetical protein